ncbi:UDP-N-acetylglucosamine 1-carboxyvinyltransferase [Oceanibacterium hippocampi]|uniref:UDP-N-acetylglucosamine 1-carboxyvinyltransferase n=1 Tax=Oceanibacterium hippocampi TaxID=745714 RepID=A0A1Y5S379_9PROT|nr:UDP-N-acetylglucosamine 1-carboxyvinyltransferase [Oceanibacterium hippocampi]SLN31316.1 UDP-N-acetylglucosamine 1-carboxyvinyltransferase [Oceanibacterium hippocampi]
MDRIRIVGGTPLEGRIRIGGAKNAALPLMCAALLTEDTLTLGNMPGVADIRTLASLLNGLGVETAMDEGDGAGGRVLTLRAATITSTEAPYDLVRKMRASALVLGPLLAREGRARVSLPGGCAIGTRPINLHLEGLEQMGAAFEIAGGYVNGTAPDGLRGAKILMPMVSVGATENLMMAAALARGTTVIDNAAREPEIADLARCLNAMGASIDGAGTERLVIEGRDSLHGANHRVLPDRIETGTYAIAAAITGGRLVLEGTDLELVGALADILHEARVEMTGDGGDLTVARQNGPVRGVDVMTLPFPGFPTDMQAQTMALMCTAEGAAMITETIFENRFMHVPELTRMGANITVHGASALVRGVPCLTGAPVMATDLRASVCLVLAALAAKGETIVNRVYHLDRGYERLEEKLARCGAQIERLRE